MLFRFSLYGFLKNQRYFEPFLAIIFYEKLGSWFLVGLLIGFREACVNILEVPTGGIADLYGRRRSMIFSFVAYIGGFVLFGLSDTLAPLLVGMVLFSMGEAFRTGTHKAMIFTWLRAAGRTAERTRVYGYTRSWSKLGSATMVLVAGAIVLVFRDYDCLFFFAAAAYVFGIVNLAGYPHELEGRRAKKTVRIGRIVSHLRKVLVRVWRRRPLRGLVCEAMGFDVLFESGKHYIQPVLVAAAVPLAAAFAVTEGLGDRQKGVLLIVPVFFLVHIFSAVCSRNAHRLVSAPGMEDAAARVLWRAGLGVMFMLTVALFLDLRWAMVAGFVAIQVMQNLWRPVLVSRFDAAAPESESATILSIESQARSFSNMLAAPVLGLAVTLVQGSGTGGSEFWPVGVAGFVIALGFVLRTTGRRGREGRGTGVLPSL